MKSYLTAVVCGKGICSRTGDKEYFEHGGLFWLMVPSPQRYGY